MRIVSSEALLEGMGCRVEQRRLAATQVCRTCGSPIWRCRVEARFGSHCSAAMVCRCEGCSGSDPAARVPASRKLDRQSPSREGAHRGTSSPDHSHPARNPSRDRNLAGPTSLGRVGLSSPRVPSPRAEADGMRGGGARDARLPSARAVVGCGRRVMVRVLTYADAGTYEKENDRD